jgi:probable HAF family extracellular repeat protein
MGRGTPASMHVLESIRSSPIGRAGIALLLLALAVPLSVGRAPVAAQSGLTLSSSRLGFGAQTVQKASLVKEVVLANEGSEPIVVELVAELNGEFKILRDEPPPDQRSPHVFMQPRERWRLEIVFLPTSPGEKSGRLLFKRLDVDQQLTVDLSGSGRSERGAVLQVQPPYLQFDPQLVGSSSDWKPVILTNRGDAPLGMRKVEIRGVHAGDFVRSEERAPEELGPTATYGVRIRFTPRAEGSRSAELVIEDGAGNVRRVPLAGTGRGPQNYRLWDLDPPAGSFSDARAISASGQMVGVSTDAGNRYHAACWEKRGLVGLPNVPNENASGAEAISADGRQVVGWLKLAGSEGQHAFFWDRQRDRVVALNTLGGSGSLAYGVNNRGEVVGTADTAQDGTRHAFVWRDQDEDGQADAGEMDDLGVLDDPGNRSTAYAINASGLIVGRSEAGSHGEYQAVVWSGPDARAPADPPLEGLGGRSSEAYAINEKGVIVGRADTKQNGGTHAGMWEDLLGVPRDLGTLGGANSEAYGVSSDGWVVGRSETVGGEYHAFLYEGGRMFDLNDRIPSQTGWVLEEGRAINDRHEIVGIGTYRGQRRAFRLGIPSLLLEPSSELTFGAVAVGTSFSLQVTLTNRGTAPLHIDRLSIEGDASEEYRIPSGNGGGDVDPGGTAVLNVEFRPKQNGVRGARLKITSSAPDSPHTLSLAGTGTGGSPDLPNLQVLPTKLEFGSVEVGSPSKPQSVTLTNVGTAPLTIQSAALAGSHPTDFSADRVLANTTLQPKGTATLNLTFTPRATGGRSASLVITHSAHGSPMTLPLTGAGSEPSLRSYAITDLGTLGGKESTALGINNRGQVVGWSHVRGNPEPRAAFYWDATSGMRRIPTPGGAENVAFAVNESGQVVGWGALALPGTATGFVWDTRAGQGVRLSTLGGAVSEAHAINNAGQIVGWSLTADNERHAVLWPNRTINPKDLGTLDYLGSSANDISDAGTIVGWLDTEQEFPNGSPVPLAFIWDQANGMRDLHTFGPRIPGQYSLAASVNDAGQIVGSMWVPAVGQWHAFFWDPVGGLQDLHPSQIGGVVSDVRSINKRGEAVGVLDGARAVVWYRGAMAILESRVTNCDCWKSLNEAWAINDSGQIVGSGVLQSGERHAFLLTPVPP